MPDPKLTTQRPIDTSAWKSLQTHYEEIKDVQLIFPAVWADLVERHGRDQLRFPREFIWLGGAPGAGKGTNTPFIAAARFSIHSSRNAIITSNRTPGCSAAGRAAAHYGTASGMRQHGHGRNRLTRRD